MNTVLTPLYRSTKGFTVLEKNSFMHLRQVTKGKVKETTGRLVGSARLKERGAMELRVSALRKSATQIKRVLKNL
ncbi:MAG TPA: hypothetical protein VMU98_09755 [Acidimicrobiales bacterium]|nr:hypothetical protein [Acidimicrobiales bacterium]